MIAIKNENDLFDLILKNTESKDLDDILKQLLPFTIDWDSFAKHFILKKNESKGKGKLCDCDMHDLARIYEAKKMKLSQELITCVQKENVRNCTHSDIWKEVLGY